MDRLEYIRIQVDTIIDRIQDPMIRRLAYTHTYGVSNNAALLATLRHIDYELACISAMLHDLSIYAENTHIAPMLKEVHSLLKSFLPLVDYFVIMKFNK